jgi:hypothetical protein
MHSGVPRQRLFLGAVPITSRYHLQEYINQKFNDLQNTTQKKTEQYASKYKPGINSSA